LAKRKKCEACNGKGLFAPASPSCEIPALKNPWVVVERCDSCEYFPDDLLAAQSLFHVADWFQCTGGAFHALGDIRTLRKKKSIRFLHNPQTTSLQN